MAVTRRSCTRGRYTVRRARGDDLPLLLLARTRARGASLLAARRHFSARAARLRQADRDRLLAALHLLARAAAAQRACFALVHCLLDLRARLLAVSTGQANLLVKARSVVDSFAGDCQRMRGTGVGVHSHPARALSDSRTATERH